MKAYWDILRELREDHDLTQAQVAAVIGTTQQVYYRYEKGINELPLHHLQTLCAYYNASADLYSWPAEGTALAALKASFFTPQLLVANFSTLLGGLFARLLVS